MRLTSSPACLIPAAFVLGALAGHSMRPAGGTEANRPIRNAYDLAGRLEAGGLHLRYVAADLWGDAFLTEKDLPLEKLALLRRDPGAAAAWEGTVHVERDRGYGPTDTEGWGRYGWRTEGFLFFGDPNLVRRIRECLSRTPLAVASE
jgi:hypothetical protein